ncbi:MAG: tetraacyldisaccharide 4'-kinase [Ignavibacteria bacterium]
MKILLPFAWLYSFAMAVRNWCFDVGVLQQHEAGVPVVSIGNLTVGGTGKTPLVEYIVGHLLASGRKPAVISRGYKRASKGVVIVSDGKRLRADAREGGDEPAQIAHKFPEAIVVVGERRTDAARVAVTLGADVVVMDDGFQHRYLKRNLDIVVIDSRKDLLADAVLPAGRLREPLSSLRRAHLIAFSHVENGVPERLPRGVERYCAAPSIAFRYHIGTVRRATDGVEVSAEAVRRMHLVAFSGIGNHEAFVEQLRNERFTLAGELRFPDHHRYGALDMDLIAYTVKAFHADGLLTTEKDVVRLKADEAIARTLFETYTFFYTTITVEIVRGEETLHTSIAHAIQGEQ